MAARPSRKNPFKGLNSRAKRLADGRTVTYYWAWKGGPRVVGDYGTPEFVQSYAEAVAQRQMGPAGTLLSVLNGFQASSAFTDKSARYRSDMVNIIKRIEVEFGDFPLSAMKDRRTRGEFMAWRDRLAQQSRRQADYAFTVLARILSWALDRGLIEVNPCVKAGRLYRATRADKVWTPDDEARFMASAPPHLALALQLALWTGQRQGDLLRLPWLHYDGTHIRLKQSKGGKRVVIKVGAPLKRLLDTQERRGLTILTTLDGNAWTEDGFRASWGKAKRKAGIVERTFHDLRGTAVTRLALADCTVPMIATLTGHSIRDVNSILDSNYLFRDPELGDEAIRRLEAGTKSPD
jgi:integrase